MSIAMGPQPAADILTLLRECEAADGGLIVERKTGELGFDALSSRYNQTVALTLDYELGHIEAIEIQDDDRNVRNDVTVSRPGGSSARHEVANGSLGIAAVGRFTPPGESVNVETDAQLMDQASWRAHLGTVDEPRYPAITINLATNPDIVDAWLACDIGSRISVINLPSEHLPGAADLILEGYSQIIDPGADVWRAVLNCAPYSPYQIAIVGDTADSQDVPRVGSTTAVLAAGVDSDDLSLSVTTGVDGLWTTAAADFPMDVDVGGQRIRLSAISGASSPQTFTVSDRSVNGVTKSHLAGAPVTPWRTAVVGL